MAKDDIINFRISKEEKATWIAEAKKRGKDALSDFIKDCVFRVIAGIEQPESRSMDDGGKLDQILQIQREQLALTKEIKESEVIIAGLRSQMARQAKIEYSQMLALRRKVAMEKGQLPDPDAEPAPAIIPDELFGKGLETPGTDSRIEDAENPKLTQEKKQ